MIELLTEIVALVTERKKYWLIPLLIVIGLLGGFFVFSQGTVVAPFIYTIF